MTVSQTVDDRALTFGANHNRPLVLGIVNVTPDSFADGGRLFNGDVVDIDKVLFHAEKLIDDGADLLDIGGESTRPGARLITEQEEVDRVLPVITALAARFATPLSIDTSTASVIKLAAQQGVALINDVRALRRPGALQAAAGSGLPIVLMHMQGEPQTMQQQPVYGDVVADVRKFWLARITACEEAGVARQRLIVDPGFGFGKTLQHNLSLFAALAEFAAEGFPVLVGVSRKRMIGDLLGKPVTERVAGSTALALLAAQRGASMIRVHDVAATVDALKIYATLAEEKLPATGVGEGAH